MNLRLIVDENLHQQLSKAVGAVYRTHRFESVYARNLNGLSDVELMKHVSLLGFNAIITGDCRRLANPDERAALRHNGLHWIGVPQFQAKGTDAIAAQTATVLAGLGHIFANWADTPTAYTLRAIAIGERAVIDTEEL